MMAKNKTSDEKPLRLSKSKRKKEKGGDLVCIIHYSFVSDKRVRSLSETSFKTITETVQLRQSAENNSDRLDDICAGVPLVFKKHCHGIHQWCYRNFTNTSRLRKRKRSEDVNEESTPGGAASRPKRRKPADAAVGRPLLPNDECVICLCRRKKKCGQEELLVKCMTKTAEKSIKCAAEKKNRKSLVHRLQDIDLCAQEAYYHESCRKDLTRGDDRRAHKRSEDYQSNVKLQAAHDAAFSHLAKYVTKSIIDDMNVERMTMLREHYLQFMLQHYPDFYNADYKTCKLKSRLIKCFGNKIQFWQPNYKSELVYSPGVKKGQAIESAFEIAASESKRLEESAVILRRAIITAQKQYQEVPWPPSASVLLKNKLCPPQSVLEFMSHLLGKKRSQKSSARKQRLVMSLANDLCYAITCGKWMMPKHLLLGMTLRHITGSAVIVTMINSFGHCASYSRVLELESAICRATDSRNSLIPPTIDANSNIVTHLCWDNFDLLEETPSGSGTTHNTHGIIIQETSSDCTEFQNLETVPRTKQRSVTETQTNVEPCFLKSKKPEPCLTLSCTQVPESQAELAAKSSDMFWVFARALRQEYGRQQITPPWAGWVSLTGTEAQTERYKQSTVDFLAPIFASVTEYATVQHILRLSQSASREIGQMYTIVTFDLAVVMKAYAIVWEKSESFKDVIVRVGGFHLLCSYMGALGKSIRGSGFEEILIESGICASGSIEKVIQGKHYNRALRVHKLVFEALERLLLQAFASRHPDAYNEEANDILMKLSETPCRENLERAQENPSCTALLSKFTEFQEAVRHGELGKTAVYWMNYMDRVWHILQFQRATKENCFDLHLASLQNMCPLFFSYDHHNYARYTTVYLLSMLNLSETHPGAEELLRQNGFSVNRSDVPSSRNAVDITIEQTINKHAKCHGGIVGFSRNQSAYYRWSVTRHVRADYQQATLELLDMDSQESSSHKDLRPSSVSQSEKEVKKVTRAIQNFINPFEIDNKEVLYCLSSGAPIPSALEDDLLHADKVGKEAHVTFVKERLVENTKSFHDPIKKQNLKTFSNMAKSVKVTGKSKKSRQITAERNVFAQLLLLSVKNKLSMEKVLSYPLIPVPASLATFDGVPAKTDKSALMHAIEQDFTVEKNKETSYIIDGNALLQSLTTLPETFGLLARKVFSLLPKEKRVDFVTDSYVEQSIKSIERHRRGTSKAHLIKGSNTKVPRDWKSFMYNDGNKEQLIEFLFKEWTTDSYAGQLQGREIFFVHGVSCTRLHSRDGAETMAECETDLCSDQEEADTRIILHLLHISKETLEDVPIVVRSPDTDVFVLLVHFSHRIKQKVLFDTGVGNKRRLIDVQQVSASLGEDMCAALPALHAFSGSDSTSAFVGKGKQIPLKTLKEHSEFFEVFNALGRSPEIPSYIFDSLEHFVCLLYQKRTPTTNINTLRYLKFAERFKAKSGKPLSSYNGTDMSVLPPCRDSMRQHVKRANYQALIWYRADQAMQRIPQPDGHGWKIEDGHLTIKWTDGDLMPQELTDILVEQPAQEDQDDSEDDEMESMYDVIFEEDEEDEEWEEQEEEEEEEEEEG